MKQCYLVYEKVIKSLLPLLLVEYIINNVKINKQNIVLKGGEESNIYLFHIITCFGHNKVCLQIYSTLHYSTIKIQLKVQLKVHNYTTTLHCLAQQSLFFISTKQTIHTLFSFKCCDITPQPLFEKSQQTVQCKTVKGAMYFMIKCACNTIFFIIDHFAFGENPGLPCFYLLLVLNIQVHTFLHLAELLLALYPSFMLPVCYVFFSSVYIIFLFVRANNYAGFQVVTVTITRQITHLVCLFYLHLENQVSHIYFILFHVDKHMTLITLI